MALQTSYSDSMSNGAVGAPVNMENWNGISRIASGGIGFGQPVVRVGDKNCALLSAETLQAAAANGVPAPAGATITASPAVTSAAKIGVYTATCITAGATGKWRIEDPDG